MKRHITDWLAAYMDYTGGSESPDSYHRWVGLTMLAAALGRNYRNATTNTGIYNNLFVLLIADQGSTRKSSAIDAGVKLIRGIDRVQLSMDTGSEAGMLRQFNECYKNGESNYLVRARELHSFVITSGIDMFHTLMSIYDQDDDYVKRLASESFKVKKPYLNFIGATTPSYLSRAFTEDVRQTGMMSRLLFIYEEKPRFTNPQFVPGDQKLKEYLIADLELIAGMDERDISFEKRAFERLYKPYYMMNKHMENGRERTAKYALQRSFASRADNHCLKVSALLALSRGRTQITMEDVQEAIDYLEDDIFKKLPMVDDLLGSDKMIEIKKDFEKMMRTLGVVTYNKILKKYKKECSRDEILNMLFLYSDARQIKIHKKEPNGALGSSSRVEWIDV